MYVTDRTSQGEQHGVAGYRRREYTDEYTVHREAAKESLCARAHAPSERKREREKEGHRSISTRGRKWKIVSLTNAAVAAAANEF